MTSGSSALMRLLPIAVFAAIALFFAIALRGGDPSKIPSMLIGKPAPQTAFPALEELTVEGRAVPGFTSADLAKGNVTIVNFWASWCSQCIDEHPLLEKLTGATGASLYGVNYKDSAAAARRYLGRFGNPYAAVGVDSIGRSAIDWGVYGMPETFVIDGKGTIVYKHTGPMTPETIEAKLLPAIEAAKHGSGSKTP
jgi:cytochrome c biogenesis protein CcmG, thiol:disulfide interchange protein DsbE